MKHNVFEGIGWIGVGAIIFAYAFSTFGVLKTDQPAFFLLNGIGAIGIIIDSSHQRDWQPVVLNGFWLVIALIGFGRYLLT